MVSLPKLNTSTRDGLDNDATQLTSCLGLLSILSR